MRSSFHGLFKRGIEYLSDVLNTAARIQGVCNKYQADLLISREIFDLLEGKHQNFRWKSFKISI
jgi:adenylate cyclase